MRIDLEAVSEGIPLPRQLDSECTDLEIEVYGRRQRNPVEVWESCSGTVYAIVTDVSANVSLENAQEKVVEAVHAKWPNARVIEYWPRGATFSGKYRYSSLTPGGGGSPINHSALEEEGIILRDV